MKPLANIKIWTHTHSFFFWYFNDPDSQNYGNTSVPQYLSHCGTHIILYTGVFVQGIYDPTGHLGSGTVASFLSAVGNLGPSGTGALCPEFAMSGLLAALDRIGQLPAVEASHSQVILVTDASASDSELFTSVTSQADVLGVTINTLLLRFGCGGFGDLLNLAPSTGGIAIEFRTDFECLAEFLRDTLASGSIGRVIFSGISVSHSVTVSIFATALRVLIRQDSTVTAIDIQRPNGVMESVSSPGDLAYFEEADSVPSGQWVFSVTTGSFEIFADIQTPVDFFVSHFTEDFPDEFVITCESPSACKSNPMWNNYRITFCCIKNRL